MYPTVGVQSSFKANKEIKLGAVGFASRYLTHPNIQIANKSRKIYIKFLNLR